MRVSMYRKEVPNNLWPRPVITPQRCTYVRAGETVRKLWLTWRYSVLNCRYRHTWRGGVKRRRRSNTLTGYTFIPSCTFPPKLCILRLWWVNSRHPWHPWYIFVAYNESTAASTRTPKLIALHFSQVELKEATLLDSLLIIQCIWQLLQSIMSPLSIGYVFFLTRSILEVHRSAKANHRGLKMDDHLRLIF